MTKKISVIMPTYNRGYMIATTIQSIRNQTYENWELIIVDDGSKDDTRQVVEEYLSDIRIKYVFQSNSGAASARNHGLRTALGSIVAYVDSDDPVYPEFLAKTIQVFELNSSIQFAVCNHEKSIELYDTAGKLVDTLPSEPAAKSSVSISDLYQWKFKTSGTGIAHKLPTVVRWNECLKLLEDFEFILNLALHYPDGFQFIPEVLFRYSQRYGGDGACSNASYLDFAVAFEQVYSLHRTDPFMVDEVYTKRIENYKRLHEQVSKGEIPPPHLKYFPNQA